MSIDWGKAPEGATHAGTLKGQNRQVFYRDISAYGYEFTYPDLKNWTWMRNMGEPLCVPLIPRGEQPQPDLHEAEDLEQMVETVSAITGSSVYINDIRWVCAALIDAGYRKFEIVEDDV
jgi:hypothetical protein